MRFGSGIEIDFQALPHWTPRDYAGDRINPLGIGVAVEQGVHSVIFRRVISKVAPVIVLWVVVPVANH